MGRQSCRRTRRRPNGDGELPLPTASATSARALVAIPDEYSRVVILSLLREGLGWDVQATTPELMIASVRHNPLSLCVIDVAYCVDEGDSLCARIRRVSSAPILVMGSQADEDRTLSCLEDGADAYLLRPFEPQHLVSLARALWRRASGELQALLGSGS